VWREPLVHFLAIGALLFLAFAWRGSSGANRVVITPGQIDALAATFTRTWQRPPTEDELKTQIDEYVREEIAIREAMAMGLDRDDTVVRRRLRQKLEFLAEDTIDATPPSEAELHAWLDSHADSYRAEAEITFRQIHFSADRRRSVEDDVRRVLDRLSRQNADVAIHALGDSVMLPPEITRATRTDLARQFGDDFAAAVVNLEVARWAGPIRSAYGVHLVYVRERQDGHVPALADVRPQIERDVTVERRRKQLAAMYESLLERYLVIVENRRETRAAAAPAAGGAGSSR
jgi:hypothetical protein